MHAKSRMHIDHIIFSYINFLYIYVNWNVLFSIVCLKHHVDKFFITNVHDVTPKPPINNL
jgi:hypothetical protein